MRDTERSSTIENIRWGILGTGQIAGMFAEDLVRIADADLVAVGSRTAAAANRFADRFGADRRHPSYEQLAHDSEVDVIYVTTPHTLHCQNTITCLEAGKAVLCEKPLAVNAAEAERMTRAAHQHQRFLMEAMWSRFLPSVVRLRDLVRDGAVGELQLLVADFGFSSSPDPTNRLYDPAIGGGALLDIGVYPIALASMLLGPPDRISGAAHLGETGVDEQSAYILHHAAGPLAVCHASIRVDTIQDAIVYGTEGHIRLHRPWWRATGLTVCRRGRAEESIDLGLKGQGYTHEAEEVARCLRAGVLESEHMTWKESLSIMRTMDELRAQWGLRYPTER